MKTEGAAIRAWSPRAHEEVPRLRRAITAHIGEPMIASPIAPMMGELLTRLEGFAEPPRVGALQAPEPPPGQGPLSPADAAAALHSASGALRERVLGGMESPQGAQTLQAMAKVIEEHLAMKGEVLARWASSSPEG